MKSHTLLSLGGLASLLSSSLAQTQQNSNCTVFNWDQQPGYLINATAVRVSAASTCETKRNETHDCPITATGDRQDSFSYNISLILRDGFWNTDQGPVSFMYNTIHDAVNASLNGEPWDNYLIGIIDTTQALPPGTSGYINFTPLHRCFEGTMSNCTGGLQDGLAIRACAPVSTPIRDGDNTPPILDGFYSVVQIPQANVTQYTDPYAGLARGDAVGTASKGTTAMMAMGLAAAFAVLLM